MSIVVDASVIAQRLVPEADSQKARVLLAGWAEATLDLLAPELLAIEIGNMLWKRVMRGLLPRESARELYREFGELQIQLRPCEPLMEASVRLAIAQRHPVYDCLYVALASETQSQLITADEKMFRVFKPVWGGMQLLRDWS
jgi:predicted nucleic acid-binding protein